MLFLKVYKSIAYYSFHFLAFILLTFLTKRKTLPSKQSPTSNTTLYRFWKPVMQPLYDNCMTLAVKRALLTCRHEEGMFRL